MKTTYAIETFSFPGVAVNIAPAGNASLLQGEAIKAHLQALPEGHLLGVFRISTGADLHSDVWEMHPADAEVLLMLAGELDVEYDDGSGHGVSALQTGHGLVMPQGVWHRLVLREPGMLLALSPPHGTRLSPRPGERS
jgi:mannose-6-phosphate isomerase-like protein (cupin superfamily)